ncbi:hypothetical protein CJD36_017935 [Flavipsychrobacter stenotrophus]|uniref:Uncharacterized protein n=1 Tax=Flavipsychrobacter stenotrophus TaxID=2077091 RepID=A0A2S7STG0_9BACT|nr:hypothetical protein [Flavipsychrobacter stenotrophus]PQJ09806.1 hypothetical protein CJD36_017935 [Flavipsychrobacter stenotrophus]
MQEAFEEYKYILNGIDGDEHSIPSSGVNNSAFEVGTVYRRKGIEIIISYGFKNQLLIDIDQHPGRRGGLKYIPHNPESYFVKVYISWQ